MAKKLSSEEYFKRCNEVHKGKYDYSKSVYVNLNSPITFVCPKHGEVTQNAYDHMRGHGCKHCSQEKSHFVRLRSQEDTIAEFRKVHGDKYVYSDDYYNNNTKIKIICPKHGIFYQTPHQHLSGQGCPKCGRESIGNKSRLTQEDFIIRCKEKFGDYFDLSKVEYKGEDTEILVICPEHGEFRVSPRRFLDRGCKLCNKDKKDKDIFIKNAKKLYDNKYKYENICLSEGTVTIIDENGESTTTNITEFLKVKKKKQFKKKPTQEEFISLCLNTHDNNYVFDKTIYNGDGNFSLATCKKHGDFKMRAITLMNGGICPKCLTESRTYTTEYYLKKVKEVHGDKFDLSQVKYVNSQTLINVICHKTDALGNEHGMFKVKANSFLQGHGCPRCKGNKKTTEVWVAEAKKIFPDGLYTFENAVYTKATAKITITCTKHGDFQIKASDFLKRHGCPYCNMSQAEMFVMKALQESNIMFESQKRPPFLKTQKSCQSLDFYLPDKKIGIECQGMEHYVAKDFFGGKEGLVDIIKRDARKRQLCKDNGIHLIYFMEEKFLKYETSGTPSFSDKEELLDYIENY